MCLGIPGRVVEKLDGYGGQLVLVDVVGGQSRVNLGMLDEDNQDLQPGEWVLIHMGFVVERVTAEAAEKAMVGLELMGRARDEQHREPATVPAAMPDGAG